MYKNYVKDRIWTEKFVKQIKAILGIYLLGQVEEEDVSRNTDLIVLKFEPVRIACRVRRYEYFLRYPDEFTIRTYRPSGTKTELQKIIEGWGDYYFYGFSDKDEEKLIKWYLLDLHVFRSWFVKELYQNKGLIPGIKKSNIDNSSDFLAFKFNWFPKEFIVASGGKKK